MARANRSSGGVRCRARLAAAVILAAPVAFAGVVQTDGTVGPQRTLVGPSFRVDSTLGARRGANLFHSFRQLDLARGEVLTFAGPADVRNVLARVTGGRASSIDGTLASDIAGANLYLINPDGILFGPNARLAIQGAFVASTADVVKLADGGQFHARTPADSVLTSAPPGAFGFLGGRSGVTALNLQGDASSQAKLTVPDGQGVSLVAGEIDIQRAGVRARGGWASLVAIREGEAILSPDQPGRVTAVSPDASRGNAIVRNGARIDTSGDLGGPIDVLAGDFTVRRANVLSASFAGASGDVGSPLVVDASRRVTVDEGRLGTFTTPASTDTPARARAGDVRVVAPAVETLRGGVIGSISVFGGPGGLVRLQADRITLDGRADNGNAGGVAAGSVFGGDAGAIEIAAGTVLLTNGSELEATTVGLGAGGNITISADHVRIAADATAQDAVQRGVRSTAGSGDRPGGDIRIVTGSLEMVGFAGISSVAVGSGDAGNIEIIARDSISLTGDGTARFVGIAASTSAIGFDGQGNPVPAGDAGDITLSAGTIRLARNASVLASSTPLNPFGLARGDAGNIRVTADRLIINGDGATGEFRAAIAAAALGAEALAGSAGDVTLDVGLLRIFEGGIVSTETAGFGAAGTIFVNARDIRVDGQPIENGSSRISSSSNGGFASGGDVTVRARRVAVTNGGVVAASSQGDGAGGNLRIDAESLQVAGTPVIEDVGGAVLGAVSSGGAGNGGTVTINAASLAVQNGALITAAAAGGSGDGGRLIVRAGSVKVDGGPTGKETGIAVGILNGGSGAGGQVDLKATGDVVVRRAGLIVAGTEGTGPGGNLNLTAGRGIYVNGGSVSVASGDLDDDTTSVGTGPAGSAVLSAPYLRIEGDAEVSAFSELSSGGSITLLGRRLDVLDSTLSVDAATTGGSVVMRFDNRIHIHRGRVNALGGEAIGAIDIDPEFTILNRSALLTDTRPGGGGNIDIVTDQLLQSRSTITAAGQITIDVLRADTDVTAGLLELRGDFVDEAARLKEACGRQIGEDFSSFIVEGRGGVSLTPGQPLPATAVPPTGLGAEKGRP